MDISDQTVLQLDDLWAYVRGAVRAGKRDCQQVADLKAALQLAHENMLGVAVPRTKALEMSKKAALDFCDRPIDVLGFPESFVASLYDAGVELAGELFRIEWEDAARRNRVRSLLIGSGFPEPFDPIALGWRPKYFDDLAVREALSQPWNVMGDVDPWEPDPLLADHGHYGGMVFSNHYLGTFVRRMAEAHKNEREVRGWKRRIDRVPELAALHAAMYVPDDWSAPAKTCPAWDAFKDREKRAHAFALAKAPARQENVFLKKGHSEAEISARRAALGTAMRDERMSPHFFDQAVFDAPIIQNMSGFSRKFGRCGTKSVRALLGLKYMMRVLDATEYAVYMRECLEFWGLSFDMTKAQLDDFFGPETEPTRDTAMA